MSFRQSQDVKMARPLCRLQSLYRQLSDNDRMGARDVTKGCCSAEGQALELSDFPTGSYEDAKLVFTPEAKSFVNDLILEFQDDVDQMLRNRIRRQIQVEAGEQTIDFLPETEAVRHSKWTIDPIPAKLRDRRVDVGDVAPNETQRLLAALLSGAQGVQADMDDGFCPCWPNVIKAHSNLLKAAHQRDEFKELGRNPDAAVLMMRVRAWNMVEKNCMVNGRQIAGALFDFGFYMFHCAKVLMERGCGPYLYLPKLEHYLEARLWNKIFDWAEAKLNLSKGVIKACVLIENIRVAFQMHEILHELRSHSAGLNFGIWDYSASFISVFRDKREFILPDRAKYVNGKSEYLASQMRLLIDTCKTRGAPATTGMAPVVLSTIADATEKANMIQAVENAKLAEASAGSHGALVFDLALIPVVQRAFSTVSRGKMRASDSLKHIGPAQLLHIPAGEVTDAGLTMNVNVSLGFILAWMRREGTFFEGTGVEDSATAEICRAQIWQWIRFGVRLSDNQLPITRRLVLAKAQTALARFEREHDQRFDKATALRLFDRLISDRDFHQFITTFLYDYI